MVKEFSWSGLVLNFMEFQQNIPVLSETNAEN